MRKKIHFLLKYFLQAVFKKYLLLVSKPQVKGIALTFDDGPDPTNTPLICDILAQRKIKATFFVEGAKLSKYPELGRLLLDGGHELGNHTFDHLDLNRSSFKKYTESIWKTEQLISKLQTGPRFKTLRTPFGRTSLRLLQFVVRHNFLLVGWTKDSEDSFIRDSAELTKHISRQKFHNGDILLFHEDYQHTVEALPAILDNFSQRGIIPLALSKWYQSADQ